MSVQSVTGIAMGVGWATHIARRASCSASRWGGGFLNVGPRQRATVTSTWSGGLLPLAGWILLPAILVYQLLLAFYPAPPADLSPRTRQVSIFSNGWLGAEAEPPAVAVLLDQFQRTAGERDRPLFIAMKSA